SVFSFFFLFFFFFFKAPAPTELTTPAFCRRQRQMCIRDSNKITNYSDATATNITFVEHYHAETRND
ncbi:hypothetical protein, partial [Escherichia coli]|uniref:hypothetical protein n=1 Tax=Escherichia coli TaxID=562 RepID=UPI001BC875C5